MDPLVLPAWLTLLLATLAALRVWRLLVVDDAGHPFRVLKHHVLRLIQGKASVDSWRGRVVESLEEGYGCPFCLGFWLVLVSTASAFAWSTEWWWQWPAAALAGSWIVGHLGAQLDKPNPVAPTAPELDPKE